MMTWPLKTLGNEGGAFTLLAYDLPFKIAQ